MTEELMDTMIEAPDTCEPTTEYNNRIEDESIEVEPEDELEDEHSKRRREETDREFARYERNYRARRIRELTICPLGQGMRRERRSSGGVAA